MTYRCSIPLCFLLILFTFVYRTKSAAATGEGRLSYYSVRDFGAKGDGKTLDTRPIAAAIQAASQAGGGTIVFGPGIYITGTVELLSNLTLELEPGAVIRGSSDLADYGSTEAFGFGRVYGVNSTGEGFKVGIFVGRNIENVSIIGRGTIDGNGDSFFDFSKPHYSPDFDPKYTRQGQSFMQAVLRTEDGPVEMKPEGRPGTMLICFHCRNVLIRDVTLQNAPNWTAHFQDAQGAVVTGIHIRNNPLLPNNDGFDCFGCKDVHFSDCGIEAGDDDFAILNSTDVTIANCSLTSRSSGIRVEATRNSTFENLVIHANRGIGIYGRGIGLTEHLLFSGISLDTQLFTGHWWGKGETIYIATAKPADGGADSGRVRNVMFSNITAEGESGMMLYGSREAPIEDISFDNVSVTVRSTRKDVSDAVGGNFDLRWTATNLEHALFKHDISGIYGRYVDGLKIRGLTIRWGAPAGFFSHGLEFEDFKGLRVEGFRGGPAPSSTQGSAISLLRGSDVSVRDSRGEPGTRIFLSANEVSGGRILSGNELYGVEKPFEGDAGFEISGNFTSKATKH